MVFGFPRRSQEILELAVARCVFQLETAVVHEAAYLPIQGIRVQRGGPAYPEQSHKQSD
jgi:hypothetical protein